jgi:NADPH:quinone reductase-like Zn-dependent oxidoreductase
MRAIVITRPGGPEVMQVVERPEPVPAAGEVLIRVKAFGLNRAELYFRSGAWARCRKSRESNASAKWTSIRSVGWRAVRRSLRSWVAWAERAMVPTPSA